MGAFLYIAVARAIATHVAIVTQNKKCKSMKGIAIATSYTFQLLYVLQIKIFSLSSILC